MKSWTLNTENAYTKSNSFLEFDSSLTKIQFSAKNNLKTHVQSQPQFSWVSPELNKNKWSKGSPKTHTDCRKKCPHRAFCGATQRLRPDQSWDQTRGAPQTKPTQTKPTQTKPTQTKRSTAKGWEKSSNKGKKNKTKINIIGRTLKPNLHRTHRNWPATPG